MATRINNSEDMSSTSIGNKLINVINKISGKNVANAKYDKTILATIQTCIDASIGQYKIKYQNGYFTAYSQDTDIVYSQGASVYVTVPENNMSNRLLISGNASNDNSTKKYVTNLEGDQAFTTKGPSLLKLTGTTTTVKLRPYNSPQTEIIFDPSDEGADPPVVRQVAYVAIDGMNDIIRRSGGAIRLGATFQTKFDDVHKYGGDYGLVLKLKFKTEEDENGVMQYEDKYYMLNTTAMNGTPFEFTTKTDQYEYWEIDTEKFDSVVSLYAFCKDFETSNDPDKMKQVEIWISKISLYAGAKVFDINDSKCATIINCDAGFNFDASNNSENYKFFRATLRVNGNDVKESSEQNLEYYWAIPDTRVNSASHSNYNEHTGLGWRCLNTKKITQTTETDLQNANYIVTANEVNKFANTKQYEWKTDIPKIKLSKDLFLARSTTLKCVITYSGQDVLGTEQVTRDDGYYVLIHSSNGTVFKGGEGSTTLTAGIYKDDASHPDAPLDYTITLKDGTSSDIRQREVATKFIWSVVSSSNRITELPYYDNYDKMVQLQCPAWSPTRKEGGDDVNQDNEYAEMHTIKDYLQANPGFGICKERYTYYNNRYNYWLAHPDDDRYDQGTENTYANICKERISYTGTNTDKKAVTIIPNIEKNMRSAYVASNTNSLNDFILGPSDAEAEYKDENRKNYTSAAIKPSTIHRYYYGDVGDTTHYSYEQLKDLNNTLFNVTGSMIGAATRFKVTAIMNGIAVGEAEIVLQRAAADSSKYTLEIVNGVQSFVYDADNNAPTKAAGSSNPITIKPLTFKLYNKAGDTLIADSAGLDQATITKLHPIWEFKSKELSLIQTLYARPVRDAVDNTICYVENEKQFSFTLLDKFEESKRNNNNIKLEITYSEDGSVENEEKVIAYTNFTFVKEGELGTNGTGTMVKIVQPEYDNLVAMSHVFPDEELSIDGSVISTAKKDYKYDQRHLEGIYLYANKKYSDVAGTTQSSNGTFVNLSFPSEYSHQTIGDYEKFSVVGTKDFVDLLGYKQNGNSRTLVPNEKSHWTLESSINTDNVPNIELDTAKLNGYATSIKTRGLQQDPLLNVGRSDEDIPNNTIRLETTYDIDSDTSTQNSAETSRTNYGYYTIPYFYYNDSTSNSDSIDPAHHMMITGGFEEVVYNSQGIDPKYDGQEPFTLFLFDKDGNEVTNDLLESLKDPSSSSYIHWYCSKGFTVKDPPTIKDYEEFSYKEDLIGKYTSYDDKVYKCVVNHRKPGVDGLHIYNDKGEEIGNYEQDTFIDDYWIEVNPAAIEHQQFTITPYARYDMAVKENLFNAWVAVKAYYHDRTSGRDIYAEALLPINMLCNRYGSELLNKWDGKRLQLDNEAGSIIASQVAAGKKYDDNSFVGVTIGRTLYDQNTKEEIGLFAYGRTDDSDPLSWGRTAFLDATSGKLILGQSGGSQIVLDPTPQKAGQPEVWSKLNGWYISSNYFFKPIGEYMTVDEEMEGFYNDPRNRMMKSRYIQNNSLDPGDIGGAGMYVPAFKKADKSDVFIWASSAEKDFNDSSAERTLRYYKQQLERLNVTFNNKWELSNYEAVHAYFEEQVTIAQTNYDTAVATGDADLIAQMLAILEEAQGNLERLESNHALYDYYYNAYQDEIAQSSSGQEVGWREADKTKANFYVTYGGKLHSVSAEIEGHISARSGKFGTGNNAVYVSHTNDTGTKYILYNKNFWVRDSSGTEQEDCAAYLNGTIIAKSGMFGRHASDDADPEDTNVRDTVFIYRNWYPREEALGDHKYPHGLGFDTTSQPTHRYVLLHKNFSVDADGETVMNGHVFATDGRIGDWILHERGFLCSRYGSSVDPDNHIDSFIKLNPEPNSNNTYDTDYLPDISIWDNVQTWDWLGPRDGNRIRITPGKIELGLLKLTSLGQIEGGGTLGHPAWYIEPNGVAHFGSTTISTTGSVVVGQGQTLNCGGTTISSTGTVSIPSGQTMQIGNNASLTAGANGFTFSGAGVNFETSNFYIKGNATIKNGLTLEDGNITVTSGNLTLSNGNANLQSGDLTLSTGNINVTTGNISATQGTTTLGTTTITSGKTFTCAGQADFTSGAINFGSGTTCNFGGSTVFTNSPTFNNGISLTAWSGLTAGGQSLENYIKQIVDATYIKSKLGNTLSVTISGSTGQGGDDNHTHGRGTLTGSITL